MCDSRRRRLSAAMIARRGWCVLALAAGCAPPPAQPARPALQGPLEWHGEMAERGGDGLTVTGYVQNRYGRILVMAMLFGGPPGQVYPWHLHHGTCARRGGPVVGPDSVYRPATMTATASAPDKTSATAIVEVRGIALDPSQRYKMDVHRSRDDMDVVACVDLTARPLGSGNPTRPHPPR